MAQRTPAADEDGAAKTPRPGPLAGLRILDLSTVIAAPWSATLLADLGADVVKVELPRIGDPLRALPPYKDDVPLWWKSTNRNKRGITLDLRKPEGGALFARMLPRFDVLVENFRPGTLDGWGFPAARLFALQPKLVVLRVTGFGQTGPYRNRPGFARVLEAMSGFTHLCGESDGPPLHLGFPVADAVAGLFGALGILAAVCHQREHPRAPGQEIDCSLMESMFRMLDFLPIEHDQLGIVRGRSGNRSQYAAPSNVYRTRDGQWASIAASTQSIYARLCRALRRPDLVDDPRFATNPDRVRNSDALDVAIAHEIAARTLDEVILLCEAGEIGFSPIYTIEDIFQDPHVHAREAVVRVDDPQLGSVRMQCVVPRFSRTPGTIRCTGPALGQDNADIYGDWLGLSSAEQQRLRDAGVI